MNDAVPIQSKAVGFTSIGNPINLIAQLDGLSKIANGFALYVCLNVAQHVHSKDRYTKTIENVYRILNRYTSYFSKIKVIDLSYGQFATHGTCIDHILHCFTEDAIAIFEEDAFVFDKSFFDEQFEHLKNHHVVMGINRGYPNNFLFFEKLLNVVDKSVDVRPGKESIVFLRRDILTKFNWLSFDYLRIESDVPFKLPYRAQCIVPDRSIGFDTSEFFSMGCILNPDVRRTFYTEELYDYWSFYAGGKFDEFYEAYSKQQRYCHYFNSALFHHLKHHGKHNQTDLKDTMMSCDNTEIFLGHLSTHVTQLALLNTVKKVYVEILGIAEYKLHKQSLKSVIRCLCTYFGLWRSKHNIKIEKFYQFTHSYIERHHGPVL